jgi:PAS domain S-box-containing protein
MQQDDPALDEALAGFEFHLLRHDGVLATFRGRHASEPRTILMVMAAADGAATEAALYLNNEFSLRERLAPAWSRKPLASIWRQGGVALLYQDAAGEPLDLRPSRAVDIDAFLSLAIGITSAVRSLHEAGLVHQNIKPANILVDRLGTCRLAGFGIASVAAAGAPAAQSPAAPWVIRGTPAYMSPEHTGRTQFAVDARSDLYSLGVILFELLTGRLPFEVADSALAGEWIHAHLASESGAPHQMVPGVPPMLSLLVLKLLAKIPDERYQSAAGLEADLKRCRLAWQTGGSIPPFHLALRDRAAPLVFPARLYGRDAAMASLMSAFQHVRAHGRSALLVVNGPSGVGKSSLLNETLAEPLFQRASIAIAKVEQYGGAAPYAALAEAFRRLVLCILGQGEQEVNDWRQRVLHGLGADHELAFSLVPELELLVGPRAVPPTAAAHEVERRLAMAVYALLRIFAIPARPLVLIVDDVQWLDAATFNLLENLIGMAADLPFMLVLTCRSREVAGESAPSHSLAALRLRAAHVVDVELTVLDLASLELLLAETLSTGSRQVAGLAVLIYQKTAGNPYFVKQFIKTIVDEGLVARAPGSGKWHFHLDQISARSYTDNVADLMLRRLARLPQRVRQVLGGLACLGRVAGIAALCKLYALDLREMSDLLGPALEADVLALEPGGYVFTHDRLQEAAYASMAEAECHQLHYAAAKLLAEAADSSERDDMLFSAVGHLAHATHLVILPQERRRYAEVSLLAARKARRACAYRSALGYLALARDLLEAIPDFPEAARLAFEVDVERAHCEFFSGDLDMASRLVATLLAGAGDRLALGAVRRLAVEIALRRGDYHGAVVTALAALREFGVDLPADPSDADCAQAWTALRSRLQGDWRRLLRELAPLAQSEIEVAMALLSALLAPASFTAPRLHFLLLCQTLELTLAHGMAGESTVALAWLGVLAGHHHGAYADGFEYGLAARALVAQHGYAAHKAPVLLALDQLSVWTQPLAYSLECASEGYDAAVANDDSTTACFEYCHRTCLLLVRGDHLDAVAREIGDALAFVSRVGFKDVEEILRVQQDFVDHLRHPAAARRPRGDLLSPAFAFLHGASSEPMSTLRFWRWLYIAIADFLEGDLESAAACLAHAGELAWSAPGHIHLLDYHLFSVLTLGAMPAPPEQQEASRKQIALHADRIAQWAAINPGTFADKHALAQAVLRERDGDLFGALGFYEQAVAHAHAQGFEHYAAIGHELAAAACRRAGHATAAQAHLRAACDAYRRWGALDKLALLEPHLAPPKDGGSPAGQGTVSIVETADIRDVDCVIRSARALSEEIRAERLVQTLMKITLERAGAQRGLLICMHGELPLIEASARMTADGVEVELAQAAPGALDLPASMLYTVIRTRQPASIGDGRRQAPFDGDPYLLEHPRCAAICIPMLKQAQLVGVLYLENRLSPQAFTSEHVKVLELLAAQAAVSLETARLYAELLEENMQRQCIEKALRESKAMLLLGEQINRSGSWSWEPGGSFLNCSAGFCRIFGFDPASPSVPFSDFVELIHPDDRERVIGLTNSCVAQRQPIRVEYRIVHADGAVRVMSGVGEPVGEGAAGDMYVGTAIDITERRAAEDSLRQAQAELARVARVTTVGQLTASIAHEVNQPLMSISSNAGASLRWLDRDPPQFDQVRRGLTAIAAQSQRAGDIIQSLQALTRKSTPVLEPVDLHATIRHILEMSRSELERQQVTLQLSLLATSGSVMGDAVQLQQVLLNIVINAVEAMSDLEEAARELSISSWSTDAGQVAIRIDDTGSGMDVATAAKMFEPFYSTKGNGMGMGLAICRSIIEAHGGSVKAEPRQPQGCRILFVLPGRPA